MSDLRTNVDQLNQMILEGKTLEAFEKFYADDVVMQDNDYPARVGKDVNRQYEESFCKRPDRIPRRQSDEHRDQ